MTPYESLYGQPPPTIIFYILHSTNIQALDTILTNQGDIICILQENIEVAQHRMK